MIEGRGVEMKKTCSHLCSFVPKILSMRRYKNWLSMYCQWFLSLQKHMDKTGILVWQWEARGAFWGSLFDMGLPEWAA